MSANPIIVKVRGNPAGTDFNVRSGPGTTYDKPFKARVGTQATALLEVRADDSKANLNGKVYQWFKLAFPDGQTGWMRDDLLEIQGDCTAFGYGLAPLVGRAWEEAYARAVLPQMRQVILRTTFVLGRGGGALPRLAGLVRWGLGGKVGHGRQGISWIHEQDMSRLMVRAISDQGMKGAYLATAPNPVSNAEFMRELRRALRAPFGLPAASWMVRLGAPLIMRTDPDLALYGRYCVSCRLREEGFDFIFPDLASALHDLYASEPHDGREPNRRL